MWRGPVSCGPPGQFCDDSPAVAIEPIAEGTRTNTLAPPPSHHHHHSSLILGNIESRIGGARRLMCVLAPPPHPPLDWLCSEIEFSFLAEEGTKRERENRKMVNRWICTVREEVCFTVLLVCCGRVATFWPTKVWWWVSASEWYLSTQVTDFQSTKSSRSNNIVYYSSIHLPCGGFFLSRPEMILKLFIASGA